MTLYYIDNFYDYRKFDGVVVNNQLYDSNIVITSYKDELGDAIVDCKYAIKTNKSSINDKEELEVVLNDIFSFVEDYQMESILIPIDTFNYILDKHEILSIIREKTREYLVNHDLNVFLYIPDKERYVDQLDPILQDYIDTGLELLTLHKTLIPHALDKKIEEVINNIDETFTEMLLRLIDEKRMTDVEVYKRANIDRKHFSKIRNNRFYQPKKVTVIALALALRLSIEETEELLNKAGYSLSRSSVMDMVVRYFIEKGEYDIYAINEILFMLNEKLLGC